jgi:hypothetical protein
VSQALCWTCLNSQRSSSGLRWCGALLHCSHLCMLCAHTGVCQKLPHHHTRPVRRGACLMLACWCIKCAGLYRGGLNIAFCSAVTQNTHRASATCCGAAATPVPQWRCTRCQSCCLTKLRVSQSVPWCNSDFPVVLHGLVCCWQASSPIECQQTKEACPANSRSVTGCVDRATCRTVLCRAVQTLQMILTGRWLHWCARQGATRKATSPSQR